MASYIEKGKSILIPFRNGQSISDSQIKPRIYKTREAFEKHFPGHYLGTNGVELVEYAEVVRCKDCKHSTLNCGDCSGIITMYRRDPVLELNVAEYIKLEYCSYGERKENG